MHNLNAFAKFSGSHHERSTPQSNKHRILQGVKGAASHSALGPKRSQASLLQGAMSHSTLSSAFSKSSLSPQKDSTSNSSLKTSLINRSLAKHHANTSPLKNASSISALDRAKVHLSGDRSSIKKALSARQSMNNIQNTPSSAGEDETSGSADDELKSFLNKLSSPEKALQQSLSASTSRRGSAAGYLKSTSEPKPIQSPRSSQGSQGSRKSSGGHKAPLETIFSADFMNSMNSNDNHTPIKKPGSSESDMSSIGSDFDSFMSIRDDSPSKNEDPIFNSAREEEEIVEESSTMSPEPVSVSKVTDLVKSMPTVLEESFRAMQLQSSANQPVDTQPIARVLFGDSSSADEKSELDADDLSGLISNKSSERSEVESLRIRSNIRTLDDLMASFSIKNDVIEQPEDYQEECIQETPAPKIQSPEIQSALLKNKIALVDDIFPTPENEALQAQYTPHYSDEENDSVIDAQHTPKANLLAPNTQPQEQPQCQNYAPGYQAYPYPPAQPQTHSYPAQHQMPQMHSYPPHHSPYPPYAYYGSPGYAWGPQYPPPNHQFEQYYQNQDSTPTCNKCGQMVKQKSKKDRSEGRSKKNRREEKKSSKAKLSEDKKRDKSSKSKRKSEKSKPMSEVADNFINEQFDSIASSISDFKGSLGEENDSVSSVAEVSIDPIENIAENNGKS
jgi:hypothetical protein